MMNIIKISAIVAGLFLLWSCRDSYGIDPNIKETPIALDSLSEIGTSIKVFGEREDPAPKRVKYQSYSLVVTEDLFDDRFPHGDTYQWLFNRTSSILEMDIEIDTNLPRHAYYLKLKIQTDSAVKPEPKRPVLIKEFSLFVDSLAHGVQYYGDTLDIFSNGGESGYFDVILSAHSAGRVIDTNISSRSMPVKVFVRRIRANQVNYKYEAEIVFKSALWHPVAGRNYYVFLDGRLYFSY